MSMKPQKENNFKAVLETIRDLMNTKCVVPAWIQNILLGYGDPAMAHYTRMENQTRNLDFRDTFLDWQHLRASFPDYKARIRIITLNAYHEIGCIRLKSYRKKR